MSLIFSKLFLCQANNHRRVHVSTITLDILFIHERSFNFDWPRLTESYISFPNEIQHLLLHVWYRLKKHITNFIQQKLLCYSTEVINILEIDFSYMIVKVLNMRNVLFGALTLKYSTKEAFDSFNYNAALHNNLVR